MAIELIEGNTELIREYYDVDSGESEDILEAIAFKLRRLRKEGKPDLEATARAILKDWQTGKIRKV